MKYISLIWSQNKRNKTEDVGSKIPKFHVCYHYPLNQSQDEMLFCKDDWAIQVSRDLKDFGINIVIYLERSPQYIKSHPQNIKAERGILRKKI